MERLAQLRKTTAAIILLLAIFIFRASAQALPDQARQGLRRSTVAPAPAKRATFVKAFVVDDRLSVLRREPNLESVVVHRLRLGHPVYIIRGPGQEAGRFCRVAVTRRTRGWIYESALGVQGRAGEDQRILKLTESTSDAFERIALCRILIERFGQSSLVPRALLKMGKEAERVAPTLSQRARKRLAKPDNDDARITLRDYYLNDAGLDRYSKLGVSFEFNESTGKYVYDGKAYREILKKFPKCEEASLARDRLELAGKNVAQR